MIPESAFGHGDFMRIRAELVRVVGGAANALVVALIFWRTNPDYRYSYEQDGYRWWNASREELSEATGLTVEQVRYAGKALIEKGFVVAKQHYLQGISDTSYSYRVVVDTPVWENPQTGLVKPPVTTGEIPKPSSMKTVKTSIEASNAEFLRVWGAWPRKDDKKEAVRAWTKALKVSGMSEPELADEVVRHADAYRAARDTQFTPMLATWLNKERWANPLPEPPRQFAASHRPSHKPSPTDRMNAVLAIQDPTETGELT